MYTWKQLVPWLSWHSWEEIRAYSCWWNFFLFFLYSGNTLANFQESGNCLHTNDILPQAGITNNMSGCCYVILLRLQNYVVTWEKNTGTVDSRYLAPVGSQNSRARVKWFSRYLALWREGPNSRLPGSESHTVTSAPLKLKQYVER